MNSRERIRAIIAGETADRCGFWLGNPHPDTWPILHKYFGTNTEEELRQKLGDDFRWISPQFFPNNYQDPYGGKALFDRQLLGRVEKWRAAGFQGGRNEKKHAAIAPLAECECIDEIESFPWSNPDFLNFDLCLESLRNAGSVYRASGFWGGYFDSAKDLFGMEAYMIKTYTNPDVVHAAIDHFCGFYYEANQRFFEAASDLVDGVFFGSDFGTQRDLQCGPKHFDEFIMPWLRKFTQQAHDYGYQVIFHSCGAIHKVIGRLIEAGVDCLHPLQTKAAQMDAETLAKDFKGRIAFMGGIDTQDLLVRGSTAQIKKEVRRVKELLGPRLIVSPAHEALLPDVPAENVAAMAEAALE